MTIVQHLVIDQYGAFLGKHSERLIVTKGDEKIAQAPLMHLESVVIANQGVSLSAEAVRECTERGIPIYFHQRHRHSLCQPVQRRTNRHGGHPPGPAGGLQ